MNSGRRQDRKSNFTKEKKLIKLINEKSESDNESEHELSYYASDRVKLMKEVLKIIKPKKIRSMAPEFMRNMDNEEINSMLLEELLGISNKRLRYIFNGQNLEEDSSSTDPEDDQKPIDVISLDDISDDALEDVIDLDSDNQSKRRHCRKHRQKIKEEPRRKKVKKEKQDKPDTELEKQKTNKEKDDNPVNEQNLMSVLELLELQARARAIRSQLALENSKKQEERQKAKEIEKKAQNDDDNDDDDDDDDAVIIELPKNDEIVITSSDSENENHKKKKNDEDNFWNGQKPINGSFYGNLENNTETLNTTQNNSQEDTTKQSSDIGQDVENRNTSKTKVSGRGGVIIQQVEIIRPADSGEKMDSDDLTNIPLPASESSKTSSDKDSKNLEVTDKECNNVNNENLEGVSKVDEKLGSTSTNMELNSGGGEDETVTSSSSQISKDNSNKFSEETCTNKNIPNTMQSDDTEKVTKCNLKESFASGDDPKKSKEAYISSNNTQSELVSTADAAAQRPSVDETKKDKARISASKKKEENTECKGADMKNENVQKEAKCKEKQTVSETSEVVTDSNKNLSELENVKTSEEIECESGQNQENKATSESFGSKKSDSSPKKRKGKCKRRMAAIKARQRTSNDESPDDNNSEIKELSKQQKLDRKSTDDDKNNTDDSEGIVLHYDQGDIECIILD
ncbi:unnamed protein product [Callosobruchus maculatus]|uniref:Uncharacterized protein n=1 Tax=Callosobruchus maculatus TaxID=64391 RepID=A0A653D9I3_CALMS|nr:unnamed protein product [Callosobruchus maculatus]